MKKLLILLVAIGITILGCSDNFDNTIVSTQIEKESLSDLLFSKSIISSDLQDINDQAISPFITVSESINGATGGWFMIDTTYVNYQGRLLYVHAEITILQNSFQGTTEFTIILHPEEASIKFLPHMIFDREVRVSVEFMGIDLKELGYNQNGNVDFAFFDDDGSTELIPAQQSHVNMRTETIKVLNAKVQHFSRYGWVRKQF